jgi:hypothetical protein
MEHEEIRQFMRTSPLFKEQEQAYGRRFEYYKDGVRIAYIWFKYALNGWNMIIGKQKERHHIDSVDKLKTLLEL